MASVAYLSSFDDVARGAIDFDTDTFYVLLVGASYTENKTTHTKRSDITGEVTGTGYTAGGIPVAASVTKDTGNNRLDVTFASVNWPSSTITAEGAAYYKRRGGAATADELVMFNDFGSAVSSSNGTFTLQASTWRIQNS